VDFRTTFVQLSLSTGVDAHVKQHPHTEIRFAPMPFDVDLVVRAADAAVPAPPRPAFSSLTLAWSLEGDPDPAWAAAHPDKCLAFLFVSPRDCSAVDAVRAA
jgi:hypothetical protein